MGWACREFLAKARTEDNDEHALAVALFAGTVTHLVFHLCVGGSFGYTSLDRYMSHVDPFLVLGVFGGRRLRLPWICVLGIVGVAFAGLTGNQPNP